MLFPIWIISFDKNVSDCSYKNMTLRKEAPALLKLLSKIEKENEWWKESADWEKDRTNRESGSVSSLPSAAVNANPDVHCYLFKL